MTAPELTICGWFAAVACVASLPFPLWSNHLVTKQFVEAQKAVSAVVSKAVPENPMLAVVLSLDRLTVIGVGRIFR